MRHAMRWHATLWFVFGIDCLTWRPRRPVRYERRTANLSGTQHSLGPEAIRHYIKTEGSLLDAPELAVSVHIPTEPLDWSRQVGFPGTWSPLGSDIFNFTAATGPALPRPASAGEFRDCPGRHDQQQDTN